MIVPADVDYVFFTASERLEIFLEVMNTGDIVIIVTHDEASTKLVTIYFSCPCYLLICLNKSINNFKLLFLVII